MTIENQVVRYTRVGGSRIAWSAVGTGPPLVIGGWWASHLALNWEDPRFRRFVVALGRSHTVLRYDRPGTGLSDPEAPVPDRLDDELAVLTGLINGLDLPRAAVLGASSGSAVAAVYAARHPERVSSLILYGSYARGTDIAAPSARDLMLAAVVSHWGLGSRLLADLFLPGAPSADREQFARFQRRLASPAAAVLALRAVYNTDSSRELAQVRIPTLVMHRRDDRAIPIALGREVASLVPGATFVELGGENHFPWLGDSDTVVNTIERFLDGRPVRARTEPGSPRHLTVREREVLALVAEGLTDAQIAERLVLSAHTIHRHVANARTKLGVSSRAAAAAWLMTHGR